MKFEINDQVIHCREGLSTIVGKVTMNDFDYFLVRVNRGDNEIIYVPFLKAENIIRHIMDIVEADSVLKKLKSIQKDFNPNTKQRRDAFKRRLSSGDINDIAYLFYQYHLFKTFPDNVRLGPSDFDMLAYASNMLLDELSLTFNVQRETALEFIINRILTL